MPDDGAEPVLRELQALIHEKIEYLRLMAAGEFLGRRRPDELRAVLSNGEEGK
jgi:hypothetical protein